jgi:hypothetical protein
MRKIAGFWMFTSLAGAFGLPNNVSAQSWTYTGCPAITDADFTWETLIQSKKQPDPNLQEPDKMAFDMDADGNTDIYFTEIRPGNIKKYSAKTKTVKTLVKLPNWGGGTSNYQTVSNGSAGVDQPGNVEEGVTGIALDPNFKTNGWVYIHWSPLPSTLAVFRVSRFTVKNEAIDLGTEKILLQFAAQRDECCHTGGAMAFDDYGDLWIAQGANGGRAGSITTTPQIGMSETKKFDSEEWGATSTHGMRGGFLRIHPDNSAKGYTIPADNFGEYFFKKTGNKDYMDTSKVFPEIYIKGTRNNYSIALDPVRRWVAWGDVGADDVAAELREEVNMRQSPGFEGWPYFVGNNLKHSGNKDAAAPTNTSVWNTGLKVLPPARPATRLHNLGTAPITGPLYRYDGDSKSMVKMPPHFNRKWFVTDYTSNKVNVLTLDDAGEKVLSAQPIFVGGDIYGPVDFQAGPDGAFYLANYGAANFATGSNTSIVKISYKGTCRPTDLKLEKVPVGIHTRGMVTTPSGWLINLGTSRSILVPGGVQGLQLYDLSGKKVWDSGHLKTGESFWLPAQLPSGALKYRWVPASV